MVIIFLAEEGFRGFKLVIGNCPAASGIPLAAGEIRN